MAEGDESTPMTIPSGMYFFSEAVRDPEPLPTSRRRVVGVRCGRRKETEFSAVRLPNSSFISVSPSCRYCDDEMGLE